MSSETIHAAWLVVGGLSVVLVARAGGGRINDISFGEFGVRPVNVFTTLLVSILFILVGTGLASSAMASGWEPFADVRVALPWPYREPTDARLLAVLLPVVCASVLVVLVAIIARSTTPGLALGSVACLVVLGLATANPVVFPIVALLAVFEWGYKINERSENEPCNWATILFVALAWICVGIGVGVHDATIAGVFLGVGVTGLLALLVRVGHREGPLLALETLTCATLQAARRLPALVELACRSR